MAARMPAKSSWSAMVSVPSMSNTMPSMGACTARTGELAVLALVVLAFSPGVLAQQGFQLAWDLGFGAWGCFGPLARCCTRLRCFRAREVGVDAEASPWGRRCRRCCACLCGDGGVQGFEGRGGGEEIP